MDYKKKAIDCVKDTVLPIQRGQFEECGCSLDEQYKKYGNTEMLIARIIDPREEGVPCQAFTNRSDKAGGSTLGNISNSHVALNTVDIGLPQLSMHSPYETVGIKDTCYLIRASKRFYSTSMRAMGSAGTAGPVCPFPGRICSVYVSVLRSSDKCG